jgi:hypothetical protein
VPLDTSVEFVEEGGGTPELVAFAVGQGSDDRRVGEPFDGGVGARQWTTDVVVRVLYGEGGEVGQTVEQPVGRAAGTDRPQLLTPSVG